MKQLYGCETEDELCTFIALHMEIDRRFVRVANGHVYVGNVYCRNLKYVKTTHRPYTNADQMPWIILYQKER